MHLLPTDEQQQIIDTACEVLGSPMIGSGSRPDPERWRLCNDLGLFSVALPTTHGGVGLSLVEDALVFREAGRALAMGPLLGAVLGSRVAALAGQDVLSRQILEGALTVAIAISADPAGALEVADADGADLVLVTTPIAAELHRITGRELSPGLGLDDDVPIGVLEPAATEPVAAVDRSLDDVWRHGTLLVAALLTGISEAACASSAAHARTRHQFGKPIGAHQAVKHRCADMAVAAEAAASALFLGAVSAAEGLAGSDQAVAAARVVSATSAKSNAAGNVQVHGGIGFTFEHPAHRLVTRAEVYSRLFGGTRPHLDLLLREPDIPLG